MDAPSTVIGTSINVSYRTQEAATFNNPDLYEYDHNNGQDMHGTPIKTTTITNVLHESVNGSKKSLKVPRAFYFFFFAAFGSLSPLMAIYFKQMAFSPVCFILNVTWNPSFASNVKLSCHFSFKLAFYSVSGHLSSF